jgi:tetratricopeptide (TPR) repeat protein
MSASSGASSDKQAAIGRASEALAAGNSQQALAELAPHEPELDQDAALASTWLDLLRVAPDRPTLQDEVQRILARWPEDPELVTRACDALIRAAERVPPDEAPAADGPAQLAARAAERCLAALQAGKGDAAMIAYVRMGRANALRLARAYDEALAAFELALAAEPERGAWWFNLGLLHKARGDFAAGLQANQRAQALLGDQRPALWNAALCAIALGQGQVAVEALRKLGHDAQLSTSGMPFVDGVPPLQVRAATIGSGLGSGSAMPERAVGFELLWVTPLSPCHGVVSSASYREASIDYGDVVLWDGAPVAVSRREGRQIPCFPLLAVLRKGDERRFRFIALQQQPEQVAKLAGDLPDQAQLFIHHERIALLCARCASGEHMHKHQHEPPEQHRLVYGKLVIPAAVELCAFKRELDARLRRHPGVQLVMPGLPEALGDSAAAGKAHQLWRGLERSGMAQGKPS